METELTKHYEDYTATTVFIRQCGENKNTEKHIVKKHSDALPEYDTIR